MEQFSCLRAVIVFVFLVHGTHVYVTCRFSAGFRLNYHGPYTIGQTYHGTCKVELPPDDNLTNLDVYWNFGETNYCHNGQKILINRKYTCGVNTVQNKTYYDLRVPDLTIDDGGTYFCLVNHITEEANTTFSQNITVLDPSITTPEAATVTIVGSKKDTGGSSSVNYELLSTFLIMFAGSLPDMQ
ncbi:uncharacterized protein LOC133188870 [Saccostrea echinata]|uniref:uncharacterized protein LOC133188870 n=1 Tax=Saccostrea echinata TaxID=191078 RepID=UPI002A81F37B|nr:uncharacterized protein LOC133188870 [Saccostrea echinata]